MSVVNPITSMFVEHEDNKLDDELTIDHAHHDGKSTVVDDYVRPRILLFTEGTYPYALGGVSTWCDALIGGLTEFDWQVLPLVANGLVREPLYELPKHAELLDPVDIWSEAPNPIRFSRKSDCDTNIIARLTEGLLGWDSDVDDFIAALVECFENPDDAIDAFQSQEGWETFRKSLRIVLETDPHESGLRSNLDTLAEIKLFHSMYWIARTAMTSTPDTDVLHVTCAGWSAIPALVQQARKQTPLVVTEHGVYVRESYLRGALSHDRAAVRFSYTRIARGISRVVVAKADVLAPVTEVNGEWEVSLGASSSKIFPIHNGVKTPRDIKPLPNTATVVSIGRLNVLKDIRTMLRVADQVLKQVPEATFLHYGPVTGGGEAYADSCYELHKSLNLGDRFRFMGPTRDPSTVLQSADVFIMTSISEGLPIALLEAMAEGRPSVATSVGGTPETIKGCGIITAPNDVHGLAMRVVTLLNNHELASQLGKNAHARVRDHYSEEAFLSNYSLLLTRMAANRPVAANQSAS